MKLPPKYKVSLSAGARLLTVPLVWFQLPRACPCPGVGVEVGVILGVFVEVGLYVKVGLIVGLAVKVGLIVGLAVGLAVKVGLMVAVKV